MPRSPGGVGSTYAKPCNDVGVSGRAGATSVLLVTSGSDQDGVLESSWIHPSATALPIPTRCFRGFRHTLARRIKRPHIEDVNTLHLSENFETLETGGLLEVSGDLAGLGTGSEKVGLSLDLCL